MAHHILGQSRTQTQTPLLPEVLDDFVSEDNPVRVVDVFVDGLDLQIIEFERVIATGKGRPGYHPASCLNSTFMATLTAFSLLVV
jgi:transposase